MALYVIGDVQGCYTSFQLLLKEIQFSPGKDTLWLVGDLVNRGSRSLEVLKAVIDLGDSAITVLGNHDLHFLAVASGVEPYREKDTFIDVLDSPDLDNFISWIRRRPILHVENDFALVHAGIWPGWSTKKALKRAKEVEKILRGKNYRELLSHMYGNTPDLWSGQLKGWDRIRFITNTFTRMRYLDRYQRLNLSNKGFVSGGANIVPWFKAPSTPRKEKIIFGHWSALGLYNDLSVIGLDTGCIWGKTLTAVKLDSSPVQFISVKCR